MNKFSDLGSQMKSAGGLMPAAVYEELFTLASALSGANVVEVGTAHGAATIAIALGAKTSSPPVTIHTIDRLGGKFSSRSKFGSVSDNEAIVRRNFREAGVERMIRMFVGSSDEFAASADCPAAIGL
ncbi:MAG: hypothetical protein HC841_03040, partial [Verrucomicrobiae bacterium]|nr:hypothetical protein [Verrucomicrobiae bacterium]